MLVPRRVLAALLLAAAATDAAGQAPARARDADAQAPGAGQRLTPELTPAWFDLTVNEVPKGQVLLRIGAGDAWIAVEDLERAGVKVEGGERLAVGDRSLVSLRSLGPAIAFTLDEEATALRVVASHTLLGRQRLDLNPRVRPERLSHEEAPSAFLNVGGRTDEADRVTGSAELGLVAGAGSLLSTAGWSRGVGFTRGLTVARWDDAERLVRYSAGEFFVGSGDPLGGSSLLLGGGAWREFSLDPYVLRDPYPRTSLFVATPSTLEIWAGERLVRRTQVAPGTLDVENLPVEAGNTEVRTVLRDAFGREVSASSFVLMGSNLLREGITDWGLAAGFPRRNDAAGSIAVDAPLLSAYGRRGMSRLWTLGARVEAGSEAVSGGGSAGLATRFGDLELGAGSSYAGSPGAAASLVWRARPFRTASFVTQLRWLSDRYANGSLRASDDRAVLRGLVAGAFSPAPLVTFSGELSAFRQRDRDADGLRGTLRTAWALSPGKQLSLTGSVGTQSLGGRSWDLFLSFSMFLPASHSLELGARNGSTGESGWATVTRPVGLGPGLGYRVEGRVGDGALAGFDVTGQASVGRAAYMERWTDPWSGEPSHQRTIEAATGLVLLGGELHLTRPVESSYSLVILEDAANVHVTLDGQAVGTTDSSGRILVPGLIPYYGNRIAIRDTDLPLDFRVNEVERYVAPRFRGGTVERFDVGPARVVVGRVVLAIDEAGKAQDVAPEWGEVAVEQPTGRVVSPIGAEGQFWLDGLGPGRQEALVRWQGRLCRFTLEVAKKPGIVDVGLQRCVQMLAVGGSDRPPGGAL